MKCGKCVVIGLQSTGEASTLEQLERDDGELNDFVSTAKFVYFYFFSHRTYVLIVIQTNYYYRGVMQALVEKHFPAPDRNRVSRILGLDPLKKNSVNNSHKINGHETTKRKSSRNNYFI